MEAAGTLRAVGTVAEDVRNRFAAAALVDAITEVPRWGRIVDIVQQDEYTSDVVVDTGVGFLVFDTT